MTVLRSKYKFHGGLHLPERKTPASDQRIQDCSMPETLTIPLNMHAGVDAVPLVRAGQSVNFGQKIAQAEGFVSSDIHSPCNGVIEAIETRPIASRSGLDELVIVIKTNPMSEHGQVEQASEDEVQPVRTMIEALSLRQSQIQLAIAESGIVGLGGAGFPTATKIKSSEQANNLLINGAECEPYICCDDRTMRDHADAVLGGAFLISKASGCAYIEIAIEDNKPEAISSMEAAIERLPSHMQRAVKVIICPTLYPSGGERQLLNIITGKEIQSGQYPASIGYQVQNVGTALAVFEMLTLNQPLVSRIVTVTGDAVSKPGNYRVPIGTSVKHLLEQADFDESNCRTVVHGGPMMGYPIADTERPITKLTNCIIAASAEEMPELATEQPCVRCGQCAEVCPVRLLPQQLFWFSRSEEFDKAEQFKLPDCIECGLCAYVCPSNIPLVDYFRFAKSEMKKQSLARIKSDKSKIRFDARNDRLEQEQLEKARIKAEKAKLRAQKRQQGADTDAKIDAVAAALARVKAKKQQSQGQLNLEQEPDNES